MKQARRLCVAFRCLTTSFGAPKRHNAACVYALIGEKDAAIDLLEANVARGFGKRDWVEHDSDFDSLRDDPRFVTLLAKLA